MHIRNKRISCFSHISIRTTKFLFVVVFSFVLFVKIFFGGLGLRRRPLALFWYYLNLVKFLIIIIKTNKSYLKSSREDPFLHVSITETHTSREKRGKISFAVETCVREYPDIIQHLTGVQLLSQCIYSTRTRENM